MTTISKDTSCGCRTDVSLLEKGQIHDCIKQRKHLKGSEKLLKLGEELSNVLLKTGRRAGNHHLRGRNVADHLNICWNQVVENINRIQVCVYKWKNISRQCERELNSLGLNSCVAWRNPLISEANQKKRLQVVREHEDWTLESFKQVMVW